MGLLLPVSSLVAVTLILACCCRPTSGFLIDNNQTAVEGQDVRLTCNRTQYVNKPVDWKYRYQETPEISDMYICMNGRDVVADLRHKYRLDVTDYTLTILNVSTNDTGLYFCTEDYGMGEKHFVYLQVEKRDGSQPTSGKVSVAVIATTISITFVVIFIVVVLIYRLRRGSPTIPRDDVDHGLELSVSRQTFSGPLDVVLELLLMKAFMVHFVGQHVSEAEGSAYTTLSSVCRAWWQTLNGRPQSDTKHWVKHQLQRLVRYYHAKVIVLPTEMLETILMRSYLLLIKEIFRKDKKCDIKTPYSVLAQTSANWWQTMNGWPQSNTKHWFTHQLKRRLQGAPGLLQVICQLENGKFKNVFSPSTFLGEGKFGKVYKATNINEHVEYAVKKICLGDWITKTLAQTYESTKKEVIRLKRLDNHPNIVRYYTSWIEEEHRESDTDRKGSVNKVHFFYIQLELCAATLSEWLEERYKCMVIPNHKPKYPAICKWVDMQSAGDIKEHCLFLYISVPNTNKCLEGILRGLNYMHSMGIAHHDLHKENILIHVDKFNQMSAKISDFGMAKTMTSNDHKIPIPEEYTSSESSVIDHSLSDRTYAKNDLERLADIICTLYYPGMPTYLATCLEDSGWDIDSFGPQFVAHFSHQAKWISQLKDSDPTRRPRAADILIEGKNEKIFCGRGLDWELFQTTMRRNRELEERENAKIKELQEENMLLKRKLGLPENENVSHNETSK